MELTPRSEPRQAVRHWLVEHALPLWSEAGWDAEAGMFVERLDDRGRPLTETPRRLMVQARQIYVFGVAARRGWFQFGEDRLARAAHTMVRCYSGRDGAPGWCFSADRSGSILDARRDFYTLAFVLLALATRVARGDASARRLADDTLDFLDRHMAHPEGGYQDALPAAPGQPLRQNPHMHLLEALMALHEVAPDGDYLVRAHRIVDLLERRLLQGDPPVLAEHFGSDWAPRGGPDFPFEPGHHFEWIWLLARHADLGHAAPPASADLLWTAALGHGFGAGGIICDEASVGRGPVLQSTRLWPYCEAAKAAYVRGEAGMADRMLGDLKRRFLDPAHPGSWIDHFGADGLPTSAYAPASSLYHICCAMDVVSG